MNKVATQTSSGTHSIDTQAVMYCHASPGGKDASIETLRGVTIILVVFGHMIAGMGVSDDSIFRYIHFSLSYIRMPLFTVISGWVYANKPVQLGTRTGFLKGKLRRLLLPMFVASTLLFLLRTFMPGSNHSETIAFLLTPQRSHGVPMRSFERLETDCQCGNDGSHQPGKHENFLPTMSTGFA